MNMREFVKTAVLVVGRSAVREVACLVECDIIPQVWSLDGSYTRRVFHYLINSPFVAIVYPDGSAQLLSRGEDECLLFAALWELER